MGYILRTIFANFHHINMFTYRRTPSGYTPGKGIAVL